MFCSSSIGTRHTAARALLHSLSRSCSLLVSFHFSQRRQCCRLRWRHLHAPMSVCVCVFVMACITTRACVCVWIAMRVFVWIAMHACARVQCCQCVRVRVLICWQVTRVGVGVGARRDRISLLLAPMQKCGAGGGGRVLALLRYLLAYSRRLCMSTAR